MILFQIITCTQFHFKISIVICLTNLFLKGALIREQNLFNFQVLRGTY